MFHGEMLVIFVASIAPVFSHNARNPVDKRSPVKLRSVVRVCRKEKRRRGYHLENDRPNLWHGAHFAREPHVLVSFPLFDIFIHFVYLFHGRQPFEFLENVSVVCHAKHRTAMEATSARINVLEM